MGTIEIPTSIMQSSAIEGVSERYNHINTLDIVKSLSEKGFNINQMSESGVRKKENKGFQKHMVWMTYNSCKTKEGIPSIVIMNSHNRSSSFKIHSGYIRFACSNQLVAGSNIESMKVQHTAQNWNELLNGFIGQYMDNVQTMEDEHNRMKMKTLRGHKLKYLLQKAGEIRYDLKDILDPSELNLIRRVEDIGEDAYHTYNRLQESLINGLFKRRTRRTTEDGVIIDNWSNAKMLTDQKEIIRVNKDIRDLVLETM